MGMSWSTTRPAPDATAAVLDKGSVSGASFCTSSVFAPIAPVQPEGRPPLYRSGDPVERRCRSVLPSARWFAIEGGCASQHVPLPTADRPECTRAMEPRSHGAMEPRAPGPATSVVLSKPNIWSLSSVSIEPSYRQLLSVSATWSGNLPVFRVRHATGIRDREEARSAFAMRVLLL